MQNKIYKIRNCMLCAFLLLIGAAGVSAQNVKVNVYLKNGTMQEFVTPAIYFNDGILEISQSDGATQIDVSTIRKLTFDEVALSLQVIENQEINLFPNPAQNVIQFLGVENAAFEIYALDGKKMLSGMYSNGDFVDVSNLPKGFYLAKINHSVIKFIKL
ncbi:MAG: hypothetical protein EZS26_001386 [Candidatus Ordinivivax streblomastigis]|uniref:Secretion system C-terminal sorting domain-containing protein n=1 Tax=Candidatus Ordinivivax streblomastigis TaxID=2540710 RepID=A0A5M8P2D4_9BACT|nr:MAG: hypothetical protein EZS26_001386 [Candidatus Ordinivivax streblomastigis]